MSGYLVQLSAALGPGDAIPGSFWTDLRRGWWRTDLRGVVEGLHPRLEPLVEAAVAGLIEDYGTFPGRHPEGLGHGPVDLGVLFE